MALVGEWERPGGWGGELADATHTLVESHGGGWAWSVPVSAARRQVTVMVDPGLTALGGRSGLAEVYRAELSRTAHLRETVRGATPVGRPWARDASGYAALCAASDGVLLVGDAASFVDPLSSYGVKKALASAWLAAVVVNTALTDAALAAPALALYEARERAMYEALRARTAVLAREAADAHPSGYWEGRSGAEDAADDPASGTRGGASEPDVAALRQDPEVRAAFHEIRARPSLRLRAGGGARRERRPVVRGNLVVLEDHLVGSAFRDGVRWLRGVDLVALADLAAAHDQVPALYEAYVRAAPAVPLPDFLGALAVLVGKRVLDPGEPHAR
jgi:hypothetical protein